MINDSNPSFNSEVSDEKIFIHGVHEIVKVGKDEDVKDEAEKLISIWTSINKPSHLKKLVDILSQFEIPENNNDPEKSELIESLDRELQKHRRECSFL